MRRFGLVCACVLVGCGGDGGGDLSAGTSSAAAGGSASSEPTGAGDPTGSPTGSPTSSPTGDPTGGPTSSPTGGPTTEPGDTTGATDSGASGGTTGATDSGASGTTGEPWGGLAELVPESLYEEMFPNRDPLFSYAALIAAAAEYPAFAGEGSDEARRREVAAFLANIGHETTGGWADAPGGPYAWGLYFKQEVGCEMGNCTGYCDVNNAQYPCAPGKTYHGRGPIQLSWNYNYGAAGEALGEPLLAQPELVAEDGEIAFRTGLWFWMTPQAPKPSAHDVIVGNWTPTADDLAKGRMPGFGMTINIINGGLECGQPTNAKVEDRVGFFDRFTTILGVTMGEHVYCDSMQPY